MVFKWLQERTVPFLIGRGPKVIVVIQPLASSSLNESGLLLQGCATMPIMACSLMISMKLYFDQFMWTQS